MASDPLDQVVTLIQAGRMADAQAVLKPVIQANPHLPRAWLLEVQTWSDAGAKAKLLQLALRHNPDDPQLSAALAALRLQPASPSTVRRRPSQTAARLRVALLVLLDVVVIAGAFLFLVRDRAMCLNGPVAARLLFIGNSYTIANDLPGTLTKLACSAGYRLETGLAASGGWTLADHAASADTKSKLKAHPWDFVILQEQSQIPAQPAARTYGMYPAARQLVGVISATGARPVFFLTWGHSVGWPEEGLVTYDAMQAQLTAGYLGIARELHAPVAPVGIAWALAYRNVAAVDLWQSDGSHPAEAGTYLAACVFYAALFQRSPVGLAYRGSLSGAAAAALQQMAADTVLKDPARWNLP